MKTPLDSNMNNQMMELNMNNGQQQLNMIPNVSSGAGSFNHMEQILEHRAEDLLSVEKL